jgi:hypothetical protein
MTNSIRAKKIKLSVGSHCELCGRETALDNLEIHTFITDEEAGIYPLADLESYLLILCAWCHCDLHTFEVTNAEQTALVTQRNKGICREIREILAFVSKPYIPPDTDLEQLFLDAKQITQLIFGV